MHQLLNTYGCARYKIYFWLYSDRLITEVMILLLFFPSTLNRTTHAFMSVSTQMEAEMSDNLQ